jgi:Thioredoxin domain-containing protein
MTTLWSRLPRPLRWWLAMVWSARRLWRWGLLVAAVLAVLVTVFRAPLAEWMWPDSRIQQLLEEGEAALAKGNLSAADGSGARELFQAALALDSDRADVNRALVRTGEAALARAREALEQREPDRARQALALAAQLQVPSQEVAELSARLRALEADPGGVELLLLRAQGAHHAGHLDGADDAALPLYQQVLAQQPDRLEALEGREDALSELLAGAGRNWRRGIWLARQVCCDGSSSTTPATSSFPTPGPLSTRHWTSAASAPARTWPAAAWHVPGDLCRDPGRRAGGRGRTPWAGTHGRAPSGRGTAAGRRFPV